MKKQSDILSYSTKVFKVDDTTMPKDTSEMKVIQPVRFATSESEPVPSDSEDEDTRGRMHVR
jgi:hypothetical protein